mmetsp:Transcript_8147/g.18789  ORF Transcript_8147/g.18789 Transcript_8147/m.18789 type:complete len:228 (-) Transcript_8147:1431-2114(-)
MLGRLGLDLEELEQSLARDKRELLALEQRDALALLREHARVFLQGLAALAHQRLQLLLPAPVQARRDPHRLVQAAQPLGARGGPELDLHRILSVGAAHARAPDAAERDRARREHLGDGAHVGGERELGEVADGADAGAGDEAALPRVARAGLGDELRERGVVREQLEALGQLADARDQQRGQRVQLHRVRRRHRARLLQQVQHRLEDLRHAQVRERRERAHLRAVHE